MKIPIWQKSNQNYWNQGKIFKIEIKLIYKSIESIKIKKLKCNVRKDFIQITTNTYKMSSTNVKLNIEKIQFLRLLKQQKMT